MEEVPGINGIGQGHREGKVRSDRDIPSSSTTKTNSHVTLPRDARRPKNHVLEIHSLSSKTLSGAKHGSSGGHTRRGSNPRPHTSGGVNLHRPHTSAGIRSRDVTSARVKARSPTNSENLVGPGVKTWTLKSNGLKSPVRGATTPIWSSSRTERKSPPKKSFVFNKKTSVFRREGGLMGQQKEPTPANFLVDGLMQNAEGVKVGEIEDLRRSLEEANRQVMALKQQLDEKTRRLEHSKGENLRLQNEIYGLGKGGSGYSPSTDNNLGHSPVPPTRRTLPKVVVGLSDRPDSSVADNSNENMFASIADHLDRVANSKPITPTRTPRLEPLNISNITQEQKQSAEFVDVSDSDSDKSSASVAAQQGRGSKSSRCANDRRAIRQKRMARTRSRGLERGGDRKDSFDDSDVEELSGEVQNIYQATGSTYDVDQDNVGIMDVLNHAKKDETEDGFYASDGSLGEVIELDEAKGAEDDGQDWNGDFQRAIEDKDFAKMYQIAVDFEDTVVRYTKVIITEQSLPEHKKTLPPWDAGGTAGGHKYKINGIVFKLVSDPQVPKDNPKRYLYGGQEPNYEYAAKSAGHEIRSAMQYFRVAYDSMFRDKGNPEDVIRVPMQLMVDYRGFRLVAMPFLPIDGTETLIYGADQKNRVMHNGEEHKNAEIAMKEAARELHLAKHVSLGKEIYAAGDVELHMGSDKRMYLIDLARCFPPEDPRASTHLAVVGHTLLYRLLRPELLQLLKMDTAFKPLSPDCFTMWSHDDKNKRSHNDAVSKATHYLFKKIIPLFARKLQLGQVSDFVEPVSSAVHAHGINIRHIGLVRREILKGLNKDSETAKSAASVLMIEMVARTLKNRIRKALRMAVGERWEQSSALSAITGALHIINNFIAKPMDVEFWESLHYSVRLRFGKYGALKNYRKLYEHVKEPNIIFRIMVYALKSTGFVLLSQAKEDFKTSLMQNMSFRFYREDFMPDQVRVKKFGLFQMAIASRLLDLGTKEMASNIPVAKKLFTLAHRTFEDMSKSLSPLKATVESVVKTVLSSELTFDAVIKKGKIKARTESQVLRHEYRKNYNSYKQADEILIGGIAEAKKEKYFQMASELALFGMRVWSRLRKKNLTTISNSAVRVKMARLGGLTSKNVLHEFLSEVGAANGEIVDRTEDALSSSSETKPLVTQQQLDKFMSTTWFSGNVIRQVGIVDPGSSGKEITFNTVQNQVSRQLKNKLGKTLIKAVQDNDLAKCLALILDDGVDVNTVPDDQKGLYNPLMWAVTQSTEVAELLLAAGANLDSQDRTGITALMVACQRDNPEIIEFLCRVGARIDLKDSKGRKAHEFAIQGTRKPQHILEMLKGEKNFNKKDVYNLIDFDPKKTGRLVVGPSSHARIYNFDYLCRTDEMHDKLKGVYRFTAQNLNSRNDVTFICKEMGKSDSVNSVKKMASLVMIEEVCKQMLGSDKETTEGKVSVKLRMMEVGDLACQDLSDIHEIWIVNYQRGVEYFKSAYPSKNTKASGMLKFHHKLKVTSRKGEWVRHEKGWSNIANLSIISPKICREFIAKNEQAPVVELPELNKGESCMSFWGTKPVHKYTSPAEVRRDIKRGFLARHTSVNNPVVTQLEFLVSKVSKKAKSSTRSSREGKLVKPDVEERQLAVLNVLTHFTDAKFTTLDKNVCSVVNSMLNPEAKSSCEIEIEYGNQPIIGAGQDGKMKFNVFARVKGLEKFELKTDWIVRRVALKRLWSSKPPKPLKIPQLATQFTYLHNEEKPGTVEFRIDFHPILTLPPMNVKFKLSVKGVKQSAKVEVDKILVWMLASQTKFEDSILDLFFAEVMKPTTKVVTCIKVSQQASLAADSCKMLHWMMDFRKASGN